VLEEAAPDAGVYKKSKANLNLKNPLYRDTATVNPHSYLVIQFEANNSGLWMFHCHIDWHLAVGFSAIMKIGTYDVVDRLGTTDDLLKCK